MADGPRCKRRKQANPKRNNVTNYNNVVEGQSDSDDEDKLHIVEEDPDGDSTVPEDASVVLTQNGTETHQDTWDEVKEDCGSEEEDEEEGEEGEEEEGGKDALVEEMLQLGDTAVIYPEAPEDEQKSMPERRVPDENGTPDALSQLLTCPYCSRGYKRCTALKEHIKLRHEKSEDNFSCSQCSYTFAYRTQLDRHMTQHKTQHKEPVQRHMPQTTTTTGGNRKFMCTECSKAFKYKHHLKEHLRIHSGEKPYECPNCKKRFSHSGSYSSHISSKKCVGMVPVNGTPRPVMKASQTPTTQNQLSGTAPVAPTRLLLRGEKTDGKPLQEQLPVNQIKSEPVEYEYKPVAVGPNGTAGTNGAAGTNGTVFTSGMAVPQGTGLPQGMVQAVVLPTVGLMSPISINLSDLQNVLKVAMDGNVFRQVLGTANGLVTSKQGVVGQAGQQVISAISLPGFVDQDGTTKIIINYTLEPSLAQQPSAPQLLKKEPLTAPTTTNIQPVSKVTEKLTQDLSIIKTEQPDSESEKEMEKEEAQTEAEAEQSKEGETPKAQTGKTTCLLCDDCPGGLDALHMLQHCKPTNGEGGDGSPLDPYIAALLAEAGITPGQPPLKNLLSLLKAYFALNAEPTEEELAKISDNVSLPVDIVKKWFEKMQSGQITVEPPGSSSPLPSTGLGTETQAAQEKSGEQTEEQLASAQTQETSSSQPPNSSPASTSASPLVSASAPSPLNLSSSGRVIVKTEEDSEGESQDLPLDLSLPKQPQSEPQVPHVPQEQPLNLTCLKKETSHPQLQAQLQPQLPGFQTQLQSQLQPQLQAQIQAQLQPQLQAQLQPQLQGQLPGFQTQLQAQGTTNTIYVTSPPQMATSSPVNIMTTQLVAITNQGSGVPCLRAISTGTTKRTILIPQLTYTYTTKAGSNATGADGAQKTVILNGCQEEKADTSSESVSAVEEQNDSDSAPPQKKMRRLESGMYACDLCDKIFQKSSSLLRHKYEHTGKRPHECGICNKAFKHKHHLIEHTRLHSGEKPYRCDKCGKCFSHSGSYSQHMNHRYSYCKKEPQGDHQVGRRLRMTPEMSPQAEEQQSDSRPTSPPSQLDSDERESEEELEEEEGEEEGMEAMSMDDIRVVQVGEDDEESEIYEVEDFEGERQEEEEEGSREEEAQQEEEEGQQEEEEAQQEEEEEEGSREEEAQQEEEEGQQENKEEGRREEEEEGSREEEAHQKEGEEEEWRREEESREECVQQEKDVYEEEEEEEMEVQVMGDGEGEEGEAEKETVVTEKETVVTEKETVVTEKAKETDNKEPHVDKENITETLENGQKETEENKMNSE
ncbi:zinc finger E-box-binding homeobox 1-like isoform X2 [Oncorhynchus clarkii lewisi]|uniref:zinc finger E-box-binding homeobox 1-like isoform X2 n=2 Tax=Oncorhynchus clarkii lewisi TaxID=490388 RepID=UPI0039B8AC61